MIQFDCHAHVYEQITAIPGARYVPGAPASLSAWLDHQSRHGLTGGVIVQVSFLGTDNSELCTALAKLDRRRYAGVAAVSQDVSEDELDRLIEAGIRGVRWNLVRGGHVPDLSASPTRAFLQRLTDKGLHLEIHLEGPRLAPLLQPLMDHGVTLVVDHFGLPSESDPGSDPLIRAVGALGARTGLYFKFSGHYRTPFRLHRHAQALLSLLPPEHVVWGSDWPHTQHESQIAYQDAHQAALDWGPLSDKAAASALYGIQGD